MIAHALTSGALPGVEGWARCDFIGPSKLTIDAGREMAQEREDVARGLMSRRDHYGNRGRSWRRETDQVFEELDYILDRAHAVAQEHGLPLATVLASFGLDAAPGTPPASAQPVKRSVPPSEDDAEPSADPAGHAGAPA